MVARQQEVVADCAAIRQAAVAASCLGSSFSVRLDGQALGRLHWDFTIEEGSGLPAAVSFLPANELDPDRHELEVLVPRHPTLRDDSKTARHLIPLWR